jgi:hypothetical protein
VRQWAKENDATVTEWDIIYHRLGSDGGVVTRVEVRMRWRSRDGIRQGGSGVFDVRHGNVIQKHLVAERQ